MSNSYRNLPYNAFIHCVRYNKSVVLALPFIPTVVYACSFTLLQAVYLKNKNYLISFELYLHAVWGTVNLSLRICEENIDIVRISLCLRKQFTVWILMKHRHRQIHHVVLIRWILPYSTPSFLRLCVAENKIKLPVLKKTMDYATRQLVLVYKEKFLQAFLFNNRNLIQK